MKNIFDNILLNTKIDDKAVEELERQERELQDSIKRDKLERNYKNDSGVKERYLKESLLTYKPTEENRRVYEWLLGFSDSVEKGTNTKNLLFISGKYGTGKTHLGCGLIRKLGGKIFTSLELCITYDSCRDFRATETRIDFIHRICTSPVLVIDEVGKGIKAVENEILPFIVNEFYSNGQLLVFLGNCGNEEFKKIIGEAGADRFNESGVFLALTGESKRCIKATISGQN